MVGCCAIGCPNRSENKTPGVTFHLFPGNRQRQIEWAKAIGRKDWEPTKNTRICSDHFVENDLDRSQFRVRIRENAVPSVFKGLPECLQKEEIEKKPTVIYMKRRYEPEPSPNRHPESSSSLLLNDSSSKPSISFLSTSEEPDLEHTSESPSSLSFDDSSSEPSTPFLPTSEEPDLAHSSAISVSKTIQQAKVSLHTPSKDESLLLNNSSLEPAASFLRTSEVPDLPAHTIIISVSEKQAKVSLHSPSKDFYKWKLKMMEEKIREKNRKLENERMKNKRLEKEIINLQKILTNLQNKQNTCTTCKTNFSTATGKKLKTRL